MTSRGGDDKELGGGFVVAYAMRVETSFYRDNMLRESHAIAYTPTKEPKSAHL